jgi:hypothetical protein
VGEHAGEDRRPRRDVVADPLVAGDRRSLLDELAVLARVRELVRDRAVVKEAALVQRVAREVDPRLRLQEEVDEDVDRDQDDRDDRRAIGRDVVLEREQGLGRLPA